MMTGSVDDLELSFETLTFDANGSDTSRESNGVISRYGGRRKFKSTTAITTGDRVKQSRRHVQHSAMKGIQRDRKKLDKVTDEMDPNLADDIIPTAIVIKNIPFSIKRDAFLLVLINLEVPKPYAFNYHFDNGIFRGLAFANFRSPEETDLAINLLNGFEMTGRKLKVEYKRVIPGLYDRNQPVGKELEMNDPDTRHYYNLVSSFKDDRSQMELTLPSTLNQRQRKVVHLIAEKLSLWHKSTGEGDERFLKLMKRLPNPISIKRNPLSSSVPSSRHSLRSNNEAISKEYSRSPFRNSLSRQAEGIVQFSPIRQPKGPDPSKNFATRLRKLSLNPTAIPFTLRAPVVLSPMISTES